MGGGARLDGEEWVITATQKTARAGNIGVRVRALDGTVRSVVALAAGHAWSAKPLLNA